MGLEDFTDDDTSTDAETEETKGNKRKYTRFDKEDFEKCLEGTFLDFEEVDYEWTRELVYEAESKNGKFILRVYSSLDKRTGEARDKGSDAIRLVVLEKDTERPVLKEKRTNRIQTWCKNLGKKIENIKNRKDEVRVCNKCNSVMVIRENNESGDRFWGCTGYPECKNTRPLD